MTPELNLIGWTKLPYTKMADSMTEHLSNRNYTELQIEDIYFCKKRNFLYILFQNMSISKLLVTFHPQGVVQVNHISIKYFTILNSQSNLAMANHVFLAPQNYENSRSGYQSRMRICAAFPIRQKKVIVVASMKPANGEFAKRLGLLKG